MIVAKFIKWNDEEVVQMIEREWIDDIVAAVESQVFIANIKGNFTINGKDFKKVEVFEIEEDVK